MLDRVSSCDARRDALPSHAHADDEQCIHLTLARAHVAQRVTTLARAHVAQRVALSVARWLMRAEAQLAPRLLAHARVEKNECTVLGVTDTGAASGSGRGEQRGTSMARYAPSAAGDESDMRWFTASTRLPSISVHDSLRAFAPWTSGSSVAVAGASREEGVVATSRSALGVPNLVPRRGRSRGECSARGARPPGPRTNTRRTSRARGRLGAPERRSPPARQHRRDVGATPPTTGDAGSSVPEPRGPADLLTVCLWRRRGTNARGARSFPRTLRN
jgi:hypothetical protein